MLTLFKSRAGRWRESWHVKNSTLEGSLAVQVHYYEDGNVQLNSSHSVAYSDLPQVEILGIFSNELNRMQMNLLLH